MPYIGNNLTIQQYSPTIASFTGNGSTTAFTLPIAVVTSAQIVVSVNNVIQNPNYAYTVSGTTLTFTSAPPANSTTPVNIWVEYTSLQTNLIQPGAGTVNTAQLGTITNIQSGNSALTLQSGSTPTTALTIDTSQNVGIGTTGPTSSLVVSGTAQGVPTVNGVHLGTQGGYATMEMVGTSGTGSLIDFTQSGTDSKGRILYDNTNNFFTFATNATERMRIDSSGRVLVNATSIIGSDTAPLQATGGTVTAITVKGGSNNYFQAFYNTSTTLIGSITGSNGSTTAYNTTSDYRLKENVAPMTGALAKVQALKPVTYTWKATGEKSQGFIAHELAEVVPDCVTGEKDAVEIVDDVDDKGKVIGTKEIIKPQGIDTSFLVATLTAAIQEQQALIESLTARITALEIK